MTKTVRKQSKRNTKGLIPFVKGDPRINRKGVPADAIAMRHMLRSIAGELVKIKDDRNREVEVTRLYARARLLFSDRNFKAFEMALKAMYPGMLKDEIDVTSGGKTLVRFVDETKKEG